MAGKIVALKVNAEMVRAIAREIGEIDAEKIGERLVEVINETAESAYTIGRKIMTENINLSDGYVRRKMQFEPATKARPIAEVVAPVRDKGAYTNISHYGSMIVPQRNNPGNEKYKRVGHLALGIFPGSKTYKMTAAVTRGNQQSIGKKFVLTRGGPRAKSPSAGGRPITDKEGNPLVFRNVGPGGKSGKGRVEPVLGPSVYQLFRHALPQIEDQIDDTFIQAVQDVAEREFLKAIK